MKTRKLLLALLVITLFIFTATPVLAETADPFDIEAQAEKYLRQEFKRDRSLRLNASIDDYYNVHLEKNDDGNDSYTLTISCKGTTAIAPYSYCNDWFKEWKDKITRVIIVNGNMETDEISAYAFFDCGSLKSVTMPDTVKTIGKAAFYNCFCLDNIDLSSVTSIETSAFNNCGPNPLSFNYRSSISQSKRILACSPAFYDVIRPDAPEGTTSTSQYTEAYTEMQRILSELALDGKTDIEKVKTIYSWIIDNVTYDYEALDYANLDDKDPAKRRYGYAGTIHSAIFAHQAICHGYSVLLRAMLNEAGLDCIYCSGPTVEGAHAWNMIRIDGKWYLCDSTWDAGDINNNLNLTTAKYFLRSSTFFYDNTDSGHFWPKTSDVYKSVYPISTTDYYARIKENGFSYIIDGDHAILRKYTGNATSLTLPATVSYNGTDIPVTVLGPGAIDQKSKLTKLVIPEGYTEICEDAVKICYSLSTIKLPSTLQKIGKNAFEEISFLDNVIYNGTAEQFLAIDIGPDNYELCDNVIHCTDKDFKDPHNLANAKLKLSKKTYVYDGKNHFPAVTVTLNGTVLEQDKDYVLKTPYEDKLRPSKIVNTYEVEIAGRGDYIRFSKFFKFKILPTPTKLVRLRSGKKHLTADWVKKTKQVSGYQIQYALNKKFTKGKKTINVKGCTKKSLKIKKLKSKKVYYVRVRTRKYAVGATTEGNLYSTWSNVKSVRVK